LGYPEKIPKCISRADFKTYKEDALKDLLKHADMRVRQKAQFELATRGDIGLNVFKATLADKSHQLARVHSIWGHQSIRQERSETWCSC
jgi:hypothetical protein